MSPTILGYTLLAVLILSLIGTALYVRYRYIRKTYGHHARMRWKIWAVGPRR